jgi:hypothetical protein
MEEKDMHDNLSFRTGACLEFHLLLQKALIVNKPLCVEMPIWVKLSAFGNNIMGICHC